MNDPDLHRARTAIAAPTTPATATDETDTNAAPFRVAPPLPERGSLLSSSSLSSSSSSVSVGVDAPAVPVAVTPEFPVLKVAEGRELTEPAPEPVADAPEGRVRVRGVTETPACWHEDW